MVAARVVVAEKPSVARDIAAVLGADRRRDGYLEGDGVVVTWAIGHLVALAEPHQMNPAWKRWDRALLPMLPKEWPLEVVERTRDQFEVVRRLLCARGVREVICATDAGREGELIFRYVYEAAACRAPVKRLWISSLTPSAIQAGLASMRPGQALDGLADAARGRSRADWLVGMNLSRAYTVASGELLSVGRVQTPTLAMVVERELSVRNFVPEPYHEVVATFTPATEASPGSYRGTWFRGEKGREAAARRLPADGVEAAAIVARVRRGQASVARLERESKTLPPPLLYDLTELQRHANRLWGLSADATLKLAQSLYETHKLLSYPRTDSRHLSQEIAATLPDVVDAIRAPYESQLAPGTGARPLSRRFVDDARVGDHHAIIPTGTRPRGKGLSRDEERIYDLVCRRLLAAWHEDCVWAVTEVITEVVPAEPGEGVDAEVVDRFRSVGSELVRPGWKVLEPGGPRAPTPEKARGKGGESVEEEASQNFPSGLSEGQVQEVSDVRAVAKKTRPPPHLTEASLLTAMETAGRRVEDRELAEAMREAGLGTPATRAATIETLLARGYLLREGKALRATGLGIALIQAVHPSVKSPELTGSWEARLAKLERGGDSLEAFQRDIESYVVEILGGVPGQVTLEGLAPGEGRGASAAARGPAGGAAARTGPRLEAGPGACGGGAAAASPGAEHQRGRASPERLQGSRAVGREQGMGEGVAAVVGGPGWTAGAPVHHRGAVAPDGLRGLLKEVFGHAAFRPHQEEVCRAVVEGSDALLVMPTGAGKSLCYQVPGLARGGSTLVVSPLIALMEDQVQKLCAVGTRAERIHSGRDRAQSRAVAQAWVDGQLDYLFVAPERLGVPGFIEWLARRPPSLIAIDEAHCISQWGHDFRPDYRQLEARLRPLRSAPVLALTATATPRVQDDIRRQLGLGEGGRPARTFIHGFRRTNLALQAVELPPGQRPDAVLALLADPESRPAIVYAPSRDKTEEMALALSRRFRAAAYHAGLAAPVRQRVQDDFLGGRTEVVVATVAFGMGVDKADVRTVVHLAQPATLEGYYQEVGRAGRDGAPSRAVLLHSFVDRRVHESFLKRDYPEPATVARVHRALGDVPQAPEVLAQRAHVNTETVQKALEKLWNHGGAMIDADGQATRGHGNWEEGYAIQRSFRQQQIEHVARYAAAHGCRMLQLVRHFGDEVDGGAPCGLCDACAPGDGVSLVEERAPLPDELDVLGGILGVLRSGPVATGRLHREVCGEGGLARRPFEELLGALVRESLVAIEDASFEKDGKRVDYQRAAATPRAARFGADALAALKVRGAAAFSVEGKTSRGSGAAPSGKGGPRKRATAKRAVPSRRVSSASRTRSASAEVTERAKAPSITKRSAPGAADRELAATLRDWRRQEASRLGIPAYRIFSDKVLGELAAQRPESKDGLLACHGVGPALVTRYGRDLLALLRDD